MRAPALLLLPVLACSVPQSGTVDRVPAPDGIEIAYEARGHGEPALVFVHGWCCDRTFWRHQLLEFATSYRVVALDLPGHGASGIDRDEWSVTGLADDVRAVIEELDLQQVVLVGHSMGGPVALAAARRMPDRVQAVVAVDTLHDVDLQPTHEMVDGFAARFEADFAGTMEAATRGLFPDGTDPAVVDAVLRVAVATDPGPALGLLRSFPDLDMKGLLAAAGVPVRCINASVRPPVTPETTVDKNRQYADYDAVILEGVGHYPMLERPSEFNAALWQLLHELGSR